VNWTRLPRSLLVGQLLRSTVARQTWQQVGQGCIRTGALAQFAASSLRPGTPAIEVVRGERLLRGFFVGPCEVDESGVRDGRRDSRRRVPAQARLHLQRRHDVPR
jgi:hypothetical protein